MVDDPIIVTGGYTDGSITINFDKDEYTGDDGQYSGGGRQIVSIDVVDDNTSQLIQTVQAPTNGKCTITIHTA